jgi:hypothetical protein
LTGNLQREIRSLTVDLRLEVWIQAKLIGDFVKEKLVQKSVHIDAIGVESFSGPLLGPAWKASEGALQE